MTRDDIIRMAREAGYFLYDLTETHGVKTVETDEDDEWVVLERFAALVAAAERERIKAANAPEIERVNAHIKELEQAVAAEREACAQACESIARDTYGMKHLREYGECAAAIRARGDNT